MESILSGIAEAPISPSAKKSAYALILKIIKNIIKAADDDDPNAGKYNWIKAQTGSALREQVLSVSPLFRELLETLGFTSRVGRPPHLRTGPPQEYFVLRDDANLEDLSSSAQILEAVIQSIPDLDAPQAELPHLETSPSSSAPEVCQSMTCSPASRAGVSPISRRFGQEAELDELRREQQERYRQRTSGGVPPARPRRESADETSGPGTDNAGGGWFWRKFGWGGNDNSNDGSNSQGRSTSSRRTPQNSRMMTLRDLSKPQRRG